MKGVCAFDIDNTLTCGQMCSTSKITFMKQSIDFCRKNDMNVVLNTARPPQKNILGGIHPEILNILGNDVKVYNIERDEHKNIPFEKLKNNIRIAEDNNVKLHNVVLIDDRKDTCDFISSTGLSIVHVQQDEHGYGIDEHEFEDLKRVISELDTMTCYETFVD